MRHTGEQLATVNRLPTPEDAVFVASEGYQRLLAETLPDLPIEVLIGRANDVNYDAVATRDPVLMHDAQRLYQCANGVVVRDAAGRVVESAPGPIDDYFKGMAVARHGSQFRNLVAQYELQGYGNKAAQGQAVGYLAKRHRYDEKFDAIAEPILQQSVKTEVLSRIVTTAEQANYQRKDREQNLLDVLKIYGAEQGGATNTSVHIVALAKDILGLYQIAASQKKRDPRKEDFLVSAFATLAQRDVRRHKYDATFCTIQSIKQEMVNFALITEGEHAIKTPSLKGGLKRGFQKLLKDENVLVEEVRNVGHKYAPLYLATGLDMPQIHINLDESAVAARTISLAKKLGTSAEVAVDIVRSRGASAAAVAAIAGLVIPGVTSHASATAASTHGETVAAQLSADMSPVAFNKNAKPQPKTKEELANAFFKDEINKRVQESKNLGGMWAQWDTVDPDKLYHTIIKYEEKYKNKTPIDRYDVLAQAWQESRLKVNAVSSAGAIGLTQFMPGTWKSREGNKSPYNVDASINALWKYDNSIYRKMHEKFPDYKAATIKKLAFGGYNAGPGNVANGRLPNFTETRTYVHKIMNDATSLRASAKAATANGVEKPAVKPKQNPAPTPAGRTPKPAAKPETPVAPPAGNALGGGAISIPGGPGAMDGLGSSGISLGRTPVIEASAIPDGTGDGRSIIDALEFTPAPADTNVMSDSSEPPAKPGEGVNKLLGSLAAAATPPPSPAPTPSPSPAPSPEASPAPAGTPADTPPAAQPPANDSAPHTPDNSSDVPPAEASPPAADPAPVRVGTLLGGLSVARTVPADQKPDGGQPGATPVGPGSHDGPADPSPHNGPTDPPAAPSAPDTTPPATSHEIPPTTPDQTPPAPTDPAEPADPTNPSAETPPAAPPETPPASADSLIGSLGVARGNDKAPAAPGEQPPATTPDTTPPADNSGAGTPAPQTGSADNSPSPAQNGQAGDNGTAPGDTGIAPIEIGTDPAAPADQSPRAGQSDNGKKQQPNKPNPSPEKPKNNNGQKPAPKPEQTPKAPTPEPHRPSIQGPVSSRGNGLPIAPEDWVSDQVTFGFGQKYQRRPGNTYHTGVDIAMPVGTKLYAVDSGTVTFVNTQGNTGIKTVVIEFADGSGWANYQHLSAYKVKPGDKVNRGDLIGLSGNSGHQQGYSDFPHLHLSIVNKNDDDGLIASTDPKLFEKAANPLPLLPSKQDAASWLKSHPR